MSENDRSLIHRMENMHLTPFFENRAECLAHQEVHQVILHLHDAVRWPLPVALEQFVASLDGEPRRWAEFTVASVEDPNFAPFAEVLERATLRVEAEGQDGADPFGVTVSKVSPHS
ncbi:hypothetical protein ACWNG8_06870 [Aeromonas veronii]